VDLSFRNICQLTSRVRKSSQLSLLSGILARSLVLLLDGEMLTSLVTLLCVFDCVCPIAVWLSHRSFTHFNLSVASQGWRAIKSKQTHTTRSQTHPPPPNSGRTQNCGIYRVSFQREGERETLFNDYFVFLGNKTCVFVILFTFLVLGIVR
jgi:hypothetical protein